MVPTLSPTRRLLYCLLSAVLVTLSFPNFFEKTLTPFTAFLGWVALIPFFLALQNTKPSQGAFWGFVFGFLQFGGILYWIAFLQAAEYLSGLAWLVLVVYLSLYPMVFGWFYRSIGPRTKVPDHLTAPVLWVALEYLRGSRPWGGFSWGELGYSQAAYPSILVATSFVGVYGLTFLMVWANACFSKALSSEGPISGAGMEGPKPLSRWPYFVSPLLLIIVLIIGGQLERGRATLRKAGTVSLLQPDVDQAIKWDKKSEDMIYERMDRLVKTASLSKPDLILWPETAAPSYLLITPNDRKRVVSMVRKSNIPQLVGCLDAQRSKQGAIGYYNAAVAFDGKGRTQGVYHKRHLVPFGEFVPFQKYLTFLGPVVGDLGNFEPGKSYESFQAHGFSYSPMICYEVIFPGDVQEAMKTHSDALVNISNDAWYGRTASPYQHAMMAVVRAAEERKPLLRAANTGICLATDPFGKILDSTGLYEQKVLTTDVLLSDPSATLYSRFGNWFPWSCLAILLLLFMIAMTKGSDRA